MSKDTTLRISKELGQQIKVQASKENLSIKAFVERELKKVLYKQKQRA